VKAFFVGLLFLAAALIMAGLGVFLYPFIFLLAIVLRIIVSIALVIFAIWLLGKFIIFIWDKLNNKEVPRN